MDILKSIWFRKNVWVVLFLGFASGLPLALSGSTLQAWLTTSGVSIIDIGFFTLVGAAYTFKFLWSPLMDRFAPPWLGRRRGWMLVTQVAVIIGIVFMAFTGPKNSMWLFVTFAFLIALASASQDISIDAYRTDLLKPEERGLGSAMFIGGWRLGAVLSGGLALMIADHVGWHWTYLLMAACMGIGLITTLVSPKPTLEEKKPTSLQDAVIKPFGEFFRRPLAIWLLIFIILYKLCDAFALSFMSTFLLRGIGFHLSTVGSVFKIYGVIATIVGVYIGGFLMTRLGLFRSLLFFGILQGLSNGLLMLLAVVGKSYWLLVVSIMADNLASGMGTAAFIAFLMALCDHRFTATQFALLSAFSSVGRVFVGPIAGVVAANYGWVTFFFWSVLLAIPGLVLLWLLGLRLDFSGVKIKPHDVSTKNGTKAC